ncbi:MAG: response regulator [Coleofasciculaceae cyanobacterium]
MNKAVILCVDDEVMILDSLKRQLRKSFKNTYIYEIAESGEEAIEIIDELVEEGKKIVVIVSDWLMPGIRGDEFLIRVHQQYPNIIKIILTGQADKTALERAKQQANLHCYLDKPWQEDELIQAIQSGLEKL